MDTSWWPAVIAVMVLALIAAVADGWGRRGPRARRPAGRTRPPGRAGARSTGTGTAPRPGEIWWAEVPYEDGPGAKDRPCLVLAVDGGSARVAKITSRCREERAGVIPLPPGSVGDRQGRASFLETDELREVPLAGFRRRAGRADPALWGRVRHLAR
ncbi:type II toxin-antitoxin system PemK/MazF family toxin [Streptomyces sp. GC420]|uniref:type II toxin-antitoxin system PemK/MazF family toxin n=1 Tax=Streptomyces sp. GC420 TaxID=2697568 RepID=UPI0014150799|nr:type II toxin-antitoxin system PemK/MazF family toxin [Streptomyces sp. GC420]NBM17361.1 type II toxin-antitoxin system PemK/MazF family toxin [Streptomyces sp. GC420]